jgi:hypothetical protein
MIEFHLRRFRSVALAQKVWVSARGAGASVKPGVERSETPGSINRKTCRAREAADRGRIKKTSFVDDLPVGRSAGFGYFQLRFLGLRFAPPQALRYRPLRGLGLNMPLATFCVRSYGAKIFACELVAINISLRWSEGQSHLLDSDMRDWCGWSLH